MNSLSAPTTCTPRRELDLVVDVKQGQPCGSVFVLAYLALHEDPYTDTAVQ
jgi:hypothetical protein